MLIQIDPHSGIPVYRQILDQVRFQITAGILPPGTPLESVRNLAATLGINSMTVSKAYSLLEKEGVIEHRRGQQLVVAETDDAEREQSEEQHLREALAPAITVVRQLKLSDRQAVSVFRQLLEEQKQTELR